MTYRASIPRLSASALAATLLLSTSSCSFIRDFDDFEPGACMAPMADCTAMVDGCETLTTTDRLHCGSCAGACAPTEFCEASTCRAYVGELAITATGVTALSAPLVAAARNDGVFLAFNHNTPLTIGANATVPAVNNEVLVTRFNASGAQNWAVGMNGLGTELVRGLTRRTSPEGVVAVGTFDSATATYASVTPSTHGPVNQGAAGTVDGFVWALDEMGNYAWDLRFGGAGETTVDAVATDASGNTYVAGFFTNTSLLIGVDAVAGTNVAAGSTFASGLFVTKILSNGAPMWTRLIDAPHAALESLAVDPAGNVYVFGTSSGTINVPTFPASVGNNTPRLIALSAASGTVAWFQAYDSAAPSTQGGASVVVLPSREVYIAFRTDNPSALANVGIARGTVLVRIDATTGAAVATDLHQLGDDFLPYGLSTDAMGDMLLSTTVNSSLNTTITVGGTTIGHNPSTGRDIGLFGFSPTGQYQWANMFGTSGDDDLGSVAYSAEGSVFVGGAFNMDFNVDTVNLDFMGSTAMNAYAVRIGPEAQ